MRVLVAGAGVAGTVSAIALSRLGARVSIVEARAEPVDASGSFLSLAVNGLRGLDALGLLDGVRRRGFEVDRQLMWSGPGRLLGDVPRGRRPADPLRSITLMRCELVAELRAAAGRAGVDLRTGTAVTGFEPDAGQVRVRLADGRVEAADLLIGADGLWSATRRALDPDGPLPRYAGLYGLSGESTGVDAEPGAFNLTFARAGAFLSVRAPDGRVWWQAQVSDPIEPPSREGSLDEWRHRVAALYPEPAPAALLAATSRLHGLTRHHTLAPLRRWHDGRVVLIGDAAHPVGAGQGASMAIEDAVLLAHALGRSASVPTALAEYEARRRPRITRMQKAGDDNRDRKQAGPLRRRVEAVVMPFVFRHVYDRMTAWLYDEPLVDRGSAEPGSGEHVEPGVRGDRQ